MKKVLIAEDDAAIRTFLAETLASEGYAVTTCVNGIDALERCAEFGPDVVVLDLMMPIADGFQFLRRRDSACAAAVVVISAAYQATELTPDLRVAAFVAKPFDIGLFLDTVAGAAVHAAPGEARSA